MICKRVVLKEGREKSLKQRHPWIFSGAIATLPEFSLGEVLPVYSSSGEFLAQAYFHPSNTIAGRVLSFEQSSIENIIRERLNKALHLRRQLFPSSKTNAFRWINAEGDGLPGLIIDVYNDVLVIQIHTAGIERLKPLIIENLIDIFQPRCIYEKSGSSARNLEGLKENTGVIWGEPLEEVEVFEHGIKFLISLPDGQKTGFFLDQREMRFLIGENSNQKRVLNCFSYTGGFSLHALKGGAAFVESVDRCPKALALAEQQVLINGFDSSRHKAVQGDVFSYLEGSSLNFDLIILDPPAFAKKKSDINNACKGYREINRLALQKIPCNSILLTSSCSHYIDELLFQMLIFQAASEAKRSVRILARHIHAVDHPVSIYHPEGAYLKSLFLYIEG
jgi:23S rRNA (cytosine1962-C5)-methyltransferase